ncbi:MAG: aspartate kinase [Muribaculaceae bacterium]|nr:aspartate kinase [Muribaculaceae bacterium]MBQ3909941.1 aspartate kinase [Muribaculaceae bacterium]MBQ6648262.1 aspartate kinase [Muribaculaceae bacterium]
MKVLKFGGTSVGTVEALRNVKYIVEHQEEPVVVVVSALGGLTDTLIKAANLAANNDIAAYRIVQDITSRHNEIMNTLIEGEQIDDALNRVRALLFELSNAYTDISQSEELTESDIEEIVSYGERLSSLIISQIIDNATHFNSLEIIRSNNHECDMEATCANIANTLGKFKGKVAVMGGFISRDSKSRRISNLGRGGSDYTAAIVASALNASSLEIWTDVDGFMTADPKKDPSATVIRQMTYAQAQEMCDKGAKVIYAPTIKPMAEKNIPIWVKNTFNRTALGTLITD